MSAEAKTLAYAAADKIAVEPTDLVEYQSGGKLIVIGPAESIATLGEFTESISVQSLITDTPMVIDGALGNFVISSPSSLSSALPPIQSDLVIDMGTQPSLLMPLTPPGYFYTGIKPANQEQLKADISALVGVFEKPRYFNYNADICAHGRSGQTGCTRCLDACPTEAISSLVDQIKVDPYRCQGGGICATVCPSGAIQYSFPKALNLMQKLRVLIKTYRETNSAKPRLIFVNEAAFEQAEQLFPDSLLVTVEETASVGLEVWFSALAWGAASIVVYETELLSEGSHNALQLQIETAQRLLSAMGYPEKVITMTGIDEQNIQPEMPDIPSVQHAAASDKRQSFYMAIDYLQEQSQVIPQVVDLPRGAIFGTVEVVKDACTLCMACVSSCPGNALQDGQQLPQLGFIESKCLQCGICVNTCPENAITMSPRFQLSQAERQATQVLKQEDPFCCISCGKPFATQSGISTILEKLSDHPMFTTERSRLRLKMCDDCRVKDMMQDPEAEL